MVIDSAIAEIVSELRVQVTALQSNLKAVEKKAPQESPPSDLFSGPMIASLLSQSEPQWFSKFLHSLSSMTCQHLMLCTLLCLLKNFKSLLLDTPELQSMFLSAMKQYNPDPSDIDSVIWYKSLMYNLVKSKEDKPRIISPQLKSAGFTYTEQTRLEESIAENPHMASALGANHSQEWSTQLADANILLALIVSDDVVKRLVKVKAVEALACFCRTPDYRILLVKHQAVQVLLEGLSKAPTPEHKEQIQVALARLCMTTDPSFWKYPQVVELANACFHLIANAEYELYQYEGGIGLTNLLSSSEEVVDLIGSKENCVDAFFELITNSKDDRVQVVGSELFCNLCMSDRVVEQLAEGKLKDQLRLIPFLIGKGSPKIQSAASGALAILSSNEELMSALAEIVGDGSWLIEKVRSENTSDDVELRVASIMSNLIDFTSNEELKSTLSEEMKAIRIRAESRGNKNDNNQRLLSLVQSYS